ncbi:hypothetical protein A2U01_0094429, partial [Trifolium medium]|nr:hypothetical protein [Trifolium medium]
ELEEMKILGVKIVDGKDRPWKSAMEIGDGEDCCCNNNTKFHAVFDLSR